MERCSYAHPRQWSVMLLGVCNAQSDRTDSSDVGLSIKGKGGENRIGSMLMHCTALGAPYVGRRFSHASRSCTYEPNCFLFSSFPQLSISGTRRVSGAKKWILSGHLTWMVWQMLKYVYVGGGFDGPSGQVDGQEGGGEGMYNITGEPELSRPKIYLCSTVLA